MIIATKKGNRLIEIPYLFAYSGGAYIFQFLGDETYTDPYDGSIWTWDGISNSAIDIPDEVLGVQDDEGNQLRPTTSVTDCETLDGSFFWDDDNGYLYIHWFDSVSDYVIDRTLASYSEISSAYSNGYHPASKNFFDGVYYDPVITKISNIQKETDPLAFGLVAFNKFKLTITNQAGTFDDIDATQYIGVPLWVYLVSDIDVELTDDMRQFTGFIESYTNPRDTITFTIVEARFWENNPCCINEITVDEFPNCGDEAGELKPVAFGEIRRGIMILTNEESLTEAGTETAVYLVADPYFNSVRAIDNLYTHTGVQFGGSLTIDLDECTVSITKPADVSPDDMKDWTWAGEGYAITGTFDNGLDIIRTAYSYFANTPYLTTTFDQMEWEQAAADNPQSIGISVQSTKGFIEEIIEPICTSIQGDVEILGDGRITFKQRDTEAEAVDVIEQTIQSDDPTISEYGASMVSEIVLQYAPNFYDSDDYLQYLYSDEKINVIANYGKNSRDPLSPVETVLVDEADVDALGEELMSIYDKPQNIISFEVLQLIDARILDVLAVDIGKFDVENYVYGEILSISNNFNDYTQEIEMRLIQDYPEAVYLVDSAGVFLLDSEGVYLTVRLS